MSLLELEGVRLRYRRGTSELVVLEDISLSVEGGELVAVWGLRRSGRSTLLRVAAGVQPPDAGTVRFAGGDIVRGRGALGEGIGYCQTGHGGSGRGQRDVLEALTAAPLARGVEHRAARTVALGALERVGALARGGDGLHELDGGEATRVAIAQALVLAPRLLALDEPTKGVDLLERDAILALLRSLADEGIALLAAVGEATGLAGADRALTLSGGELRGDAVPSPPADVVELRRSVA